MRLSVLGFASLLVLAACGGDKEEAATAEGAGTEASASAGNAGVSAGGVMRVRPGLWRTVRRDSASGRAETTEECITPDEATLDAADFSKDLPEGCTNSTSRAGGAMVFKTSCPTGQGMPNTEMEFRIRTQGETRYTGAMTMTLPMPQGPQTMTMQMEGSYVGPCPPGGADSAAE